MLLRLRVCRQGMLVGLPTWLCENFFILFLCSNSSFYLVYLYYMTTLFYFILFIFETSLLQIVMFSIPKATFQSINFVINIMMPIFL